MSTETKGADRYVYAFGCGKDKKSDAPIDATILGGKGKGLVEMSNMGLPVPPGFVVTTKACSRYSEVKYVPEEIIEQIKQGVKILEEERNEKLGGPGDLLLLAVRSGARVSMPGMMETILDLGLNDENVGVFAEKMKSEKVAYDCYRRFISMYSSVVDGVDGQIHERILHNARTRHNVPTDIELPTEALKSICQQFKEVYLQHTGKEFPQDPYVQLMNAVVGVFKSWNADKAIAYRAFHGYPDHWGTAVNIMTMVFGNRGEDSATGVGFTRDPATGDHHFYGEFLPNAQGEDVVAGIRTPQPVNKMQAMLTGTKLPNLEETMPEMYKMLEYTAKILEDHFHDMQDVEFTIDNGKFYILQTRRGKRTAVASMKIALDMLEENMVSEEEALLQVDPNALPQLLLPIFNVRDTIRNAQNLVATGLNAGPGAACGVIAFTSGEAEKLSKAGKTCILVRNETTPDDFAGMVAAAGILTTRGGATSHAAVVARGLGKPCVCGCSALVIDETRRTVSVRDHVLGEGDFVSIDGATGHVYFAKLETSPAHVMQVLIEKTMKPEDSVVYQMFERFMALADRYARMEVHANADTGTDATVASYLGATGIGLVRTEHMFLEKERLRMVRRALFAKNNTERDAAVKEILPCQRGDMLEIFKQMRGHPVTIRLLDPPQHEFLPSKPAEVEEMRADLKLTEDEYNTIIRGLEEHNPMLGLRGCRLGICKPELTEMQCRAIFEAGCDAVRHFQGVPSAVKIEIMVPLVSTPKEFAHQKGVVDRVAKAVFEEQRMNVKYKVGSMVEVPRACYITDELARSGCEFISFGTNDLTQCTFGMSRDDSESFLPLYIQGLPVFRGDSDRMQMMNENPFNVLDEEGVGSMMRQSVRLARSVDPRISCGICGEHGGEGKSVHFCESIGLNYVSCSPYRIPTARLAAAQAMIRKMKERMPPPAPKKPAEQEVQM